ncbi:hypothetical protein [Methylobacterium sp. CM6257]
MAATYTIESVAKHMLMVDWPFPHASDGEVNFQALYSEMSKVFPGLASHDFVAAYNHCIDAKRAKDNHRAI